MHALPRQSQRRTRRPAFTIIELLVVVAIIAVLAGLLMPALNHALNKAHESATLNRIHNCEIAASAFFNDHGDYPPTHWAELDALFEYDPNDDGVYDVFAGLDDTTNPSTVNEGGEVFTACVASRRGGPYMELDDSELRNVDDPDNTNVPNDADDLPDGDYDTAAGDVAACTNWYFGGSQIFEIVDWWGNPLVYFHNRDYYDYDGYDNTGAIDTGEAATYADLDGNHVNVFARSTDGFMTQNYPNLNSFQLYSWGLDELPGCLNNAGAPNPNEPGYYPGWTKASGNLTNWEE
jgi:prepilin-type N-terminal cleavage/methylation domain-containing protein